MNVPFTDLNLIHRGLKSEVLQKFGEIIDNSSFILGNSVKSFEEHFATATGAKHCIATSSGTDANHMTLWAIGTRPGDEVIIPANTFIATAWGATLCGAKVVFADCENDSYNIAPSDVEKRITKKTKAVVAVHLYGQTANMEPLRQLCDAHNITLIEDAAQAHFAEYKGNRAGNLSVCASFSFYPGKNLGAFGEGGAVTTNDNEIASKCRMLRDHGSSKKYYHDIYGHNYRMEGLQGAVLDIKLKHLDEWTSKRRNAAKLYDQLLGNIDQVETPTEMHYAKHVYHLYVIKCKDRDKVSQFLNSKGIGTGLHYPLPLHLQNCFSELGYKKGDFPITEDLAENCLSLPMFPGITREQIEYVAESLIDYFGNK